MRQHAVLLVLVLWLGLSALAGGRTWTDSTGAYRLEADLIGFDEASVVLKKDDHQLVAFPIDKLSPEDRAYLKSKDAADHARRSADAMQTWTMVSGLKVIGRVVDYARKGVTIQQRRGKTYVNDRLFDNLPQVYQRMLPQLVAHFEKTQIDDKRGLDSWVMKLRGEPRTFTCEGVMLELENRDEYGVPFFFFSEADLKVLQPGWQRWVAAENDRTKQEQESFLLQSRPRLISKIAWLNSRLPCCNYNCRPSTLASWICGKCGCFRRPAHQVPRWRSSCRRATAGRRPQRL